MTTLARFRAGDVIEIEWVDSMRSSGWDARKGYEERHDEADRALHRSVGFLLKTTAQSVTIVQSWAVLGDGAESLCDAINVPTSAIERVSLLRRGSKSVVVIHRP